MRLFFLPGKLIWSPGHLEIKSKVFNNDFHRVIETMKSNITITLPKGN